MSFFETSISICGPFRQLRQMLEEHTYEGHVSIHDSSMANNLGFDGAPIEGPTHFSQFDPLMFKLFGQAWFETGCISAHYQNMVVEGEEVRVFGTLNNDRKSAIIRAEKRDGTNANWFGKHWARSPSHDVGYSSRKASPLRTTGDPSRPKSGYERQTARTRHYGF